MRAATSSPSAPPCRFRDGDRWLVVGDSITYRGFYHRWVELFYQTRFPAQRLEVFNKGLPADTAEGAVKRFTWDLLPTNATVATIMFGMNDVGRNLYAPGQESTHFAELRAERIDRYERAMCALVQLLQQSGARVVLLTPSIYDQTAVGLARRNLPGVNDALAECSRRAVALAKAFGAAVIDLQRPMLELNVRRQLNDPQFTIVGPDRVHPGPAGHLFMAYHFLRAQGVPGDVARVGIDARTARVTMTRNCRIDEITASAEGTRFRYLARSLPFPIDPSASPALAWIAFNEDLNREIMQIRGLGPGDYQLEMDGEPIGVFTASDLSVGVNLALEPKAPQLQQAFRVLELSTTRWETEQNLRRLADLEHKLAPTHATRLSLEEMETLAKIKGQKSGGQGTVGTVLESYRQLKAREPELRAEMERLESEICDAAKPEPHLISLARHMREPGS